MPAVVTQSRESSGQWVVCEQIIAAVLGYDVQVGPADDLFQMRHIRAVG